MKKKRILFLISDKKMGGVMTMVESLTGSYLSKQFDFKTVCLDAHEAINERVTPDVVVINKACTWKRIPNLLWLYLRKRKTQVVIIEHHYTEGFETHQVPEKKRFRLMLKISYSLADRVVAVSEAQADWMFKNNLVEGDKLYQINPAVKLKEFLEVSDRQPHKEIHLAAYGRFCQQKGFDILLEAMKLIPQHTVNLYLGGDGPDKEDLKERALGLTNVKFCGAIDDVPQFLEGCDAVVISSRWEPFGLVCMEAKAAGKPVIASDIDGLREQVRDCGILVPPEEPVKLAEAIASLGESDLLTWGQNGRNSVKDARDQFLTQWENLLVELTQT
ncbi:glycosyltransferase family 4 protein [Laspinema olomoucense]|uniref:Glycosyltransferase family 4 protein n=1 Tax=Laspinema olomoucense D3b TaxID=2953688 RepID=A0ABT2NEZ6_9CYAN|nr:MULTISPECIES: glycosyltransferase family 4 protein [unclassified Laspinema]MCT7973538.1 glycosyltransferase family 4 protein [Laspinema sp. D3d]MCT7981122.1 glycosyltransferase family 4 protein [Laspinema sp. D3b]